MFLIEVSIVFVVLWGGTWFLVRLVCGDVGLVMQVCSMHWLREFMISWSYLCASSHCVGVKFV